jgi:hypothetical protein
MIMVKGMLFGATAEAMYDWLWHSGRIDNRMEVVPGGCLGKSVRRIVKEMMGNLVGEMVATTLYDWLP